MKAYARSRPDKNAEWPKPELYDSKVKEANKAHYNKHTTWIIVE